MILSSRNKIKLDGVECEYIIHRKRIKNLYFRVKEDMIIHVSANRLISKKRIEDLLEENAAAIFKMMKTQENKQIKELKYLGNTLNLIENDKVFIEGNRIFAPNEEDAFKYIHSKAKDIFTERVNRLKHQFPDLPEFTLKVRNMKTRWGVCNKKSMTITLNSELITKEEHLIDYVIIHELCHFKHMDHSKEYWKYVESFSPYYKKMRKELKY